jgi:hypothetical protein
MQQLYPSLDKAGMCETERGQEERLRQWVSNVSKGFLTYPLLRPQLT